MKRGGYEMKRWFSIMLAALLTAVIAHSSVWAQPGGSVELTAVAELEVEVVNAQGDKKLLRVPAARVVPGDFVIYTINYTNTGAEPAESVVISNPVPEHMRYMEGSAAGDNTVMTFSVDDGKSYDLPENLTIVDGDGKERPAMGPDYTHIRWTLQKELAPEEKGLVTFRAQLE
jgi:uncharacterized repeat protein (TIGR01451 family)